MSGLAYGRFDNRSPPSRNLVSSPLFAWIQDARTGWMWTGDDRSVRPRPPRGTDVPMDRRRVRIVKPTDALVAEYRNAG
jgi:hypothetical protein